MTTAVQLVPLPRQGTLKRTHFTLGVIPAPPANSPRGFWMTFPFGTRRSVPTRLPCCPRGLPLSLYGIGGEIATDLRADMFGVNASAYVRIPFTCPDAAGFNSLTLRMKY